MVRNTKLLWGLIGSLILLLAVFGWKYAELLGTRKVAAVGDLVITEGDWTRELKGKYGQLVLNKMIDRQVVLQQAEKNGITISDQELEAEWQKLNDRFADRDQVLEDIKRETGLETEEWKEELRHYLLLEKIATMDIDISEQEAFRFYEANREKYNQPPLARISAIYSKNKAESEQVIRELENGADFQTLAKERSNEIYSAASGGDLGWISLLGGDIEQEVSEQALLLKEGEISPPIAVEKGFAVIKVIQKKEGVIRNFDEVKPEIKRELALNQVGSLEHVLEKLRNGMDVEIFQMK